MKPLAAALALLFVVFASAEVHLSSIGFSERRKFTYDVWMNVTSEVLGMSPQVSKYAYRALVSFYCKNESKHGHDMVMQFDKYEESNSLASVGSKTDSVEMKPNKDVSKELEQPILVKFRNGLVESRTKSDHESLVAGKIIESMLRNFEVHIVETALISDRDSRQYPVTYNMTRPSPSGYYSSHYLITSNPYPNFPKEKNVINITRTDNFDNIPYAAYEQHSNHDQQGCPGVCKKDRVGKENSASCPPGWETHNTPMKQSYVQHHNLIIKGGKPIYDIISTKETHKANFVQNMQVTIESLVRLKHISDTPIPEPTGQTTHKKLKEWRGEESEEEINKHCKYTTPEEAIEIVKRLLEEIPNLILKGSIVGESKEITEKLNLLRELLTILHHTHLDKIQEGIVSLEEIAEASVEDKIKRQIWLDLLPLIGTHASVSHCMHLMETSVNEKHYGIISPFEAKFLFEVLPQNIRKPNGTTIQILSDMCDIIKERPVPGKKMYYAACRMAVARLIRRMCYRDNAMEEEKKPNYLQQLLRETDDYKTIRCPRPEVKKYLQDMFANMKETTDKTKLIIDLDSLAVCGEPSVFRILESCVAGNIPEVTPSYRDYFKTVCIYALHNLVEQYPKRVKEILLPVFTNRTETPKVRTAAFSGIIKGQLTVAELQLIAEQTWHEPSEEVCSYVTTTLETYGNSSIPCDQLSAQRIKTVFPQIKRCDYGKLKAQNRKNTFYDDLSSMGLVHHFEFTPSNESFFPSAFYLSSNYFDGILSSDIFKFAVNSQGMSSKYIWDDVLSAFGLKPAANIPKSKESEIFPEVEMADRGNENWRFTVFEKIGYWMSYNYMDDEEYRNGDIMPLMKDHFMKYVTKKNDEYHAHWVLPFMPATSLWKSFAMISPQPIETKKTSTFLPHLKLIIKPIQEGLTIDLHLNLHHSTHYSTNIMNSGDCKHVGVSHEKKTAMSFAAKIKFFYKDGKMSFSYSFPGLRKHPKQVILTHTSQTETYAKGHALDSSIERKTIQTIPALFVRNETFGFPGLPSFEINQYTEDISLGFGNKPRNTEEVVRQCFEDYTGWETKEVKVFQKVDYQKWKPESEVEMSITHSHEFVKPKEHKVKPDDSWVNAIKFDDKDDEKDVSEQENNIGTHVSRVKHVRDRLSLTVVENGNGQPSNRVSFIVDHNRTLERDVHSWRFTWHASTSDMKYGAVAQGVTLYTDKLNIFNGGDDKESQRAVIICSVHLQDIQGLTKPFMIFKAVLDHKSPAEQLNKLLQKPLDPKHFQPETYEQCQRDIEIGKSQSVACRKAIRERAQFNHGIIKWMHKDLPTELSDKWWRVKLAIISAVSEHLEILENRSQKNHWVVEFDYINKLTDKPSYDVKVFGEKNVWNFKNIQIPILPLSSIDSWEDVYIQHYTNNTYPATCTLSEKYVTTFDLEDIALPKDKACSYILTSHCVRHKKFAVIIQRDPKPDGHLKIIVHIGPDTVVLTPEKESKHEVKYNGKSHYVDIWNPIMLNYEQNIYATVTKPHDGKEHTTIHAEKAGVKVLIDGEHVSVQVHPRYKGELCGLCSEFNGERVREMRGPSRCLYSHVDDYTSSCALGSCNSRQAKHKSICSNDDYDFTDLDDKDEIPDDKEYEPTLKRNKISRKGSEVCFSVKCHPHCGPNHEPKEVKTEEIGYHCLPKTDENTKKLLIERGRRCLGELEPKKVDMVKKASIDTKCVERR